jgi:Zn-dependent M28 family amino/carboxypeptidase
VLFDGEDLGRPGHPREYSQGAQHLVREWSAITGGAPLPAGVVVVDMVGDLDLRIPPERTAEARFPELTRRIWSAAKRLGHGRHFPTGPARAVFDDHRPFLEAGVPAALLIDFEYPWWHTQEDTIDKCSPESLATVGQVVLEALFAE